MRSKVIVCSYRDWALQIYMRLASDKQLTSRFEFVLALDHDSLVESTQIDPDIIICIGWSWKVPDAITAKYFVCGIHPSDLPMYAGGSAIQHQILDGVEHTKNSLFKFSSSIDNGPVIEKIDLSLKGDINEIFDELIITSLILIINLLTKYPNVPLSSSNSEVTGLKRFKPEDSRLEINLPNGITTRDLYNKIRCRQTPYPNAFIKDSSGTLRFKDVEFTEN